DGRAEAGLRQQRRHGEGGALIAWRQEFADNAREDAMLLQYSEARRCFGVALFRVLSSPEQLAMDCAVRALHPLPPELVEFDERTRHVVSRLAIHGELQLGRGFLAGEQVDEPTDGLER